MKLKVLELFSGTQSISKEFRNKGHETLCVEFNDLFENNEWNLHQWTTDILNVSVEK